MYPVLFDAGFFTVKSYYFFMSLGIIAGFAVLYHSIRSTAGSLKTTLLFAAVIFIPFTAGAILGQCAENLITARPSCSRGAFGSASLWWGLAAAAGSAFFIARMLKTDVWQTADHFARPIAIGGFFMKLGCFLNGCCFGNQCPADFPFSVMYPYNSQAFTVFEGRPVYPAQVFESLAWLFIFMVLSIIAKAPGFKGRQMLVLLILFAGSRFVIDHFRYHPDIGSMVISQTWAIITISLSFLALFLRQKSR